MTSARKKPKGLGLGLEALLGPSVGDDGEAGSAPRTLALDRLQRGRYQPRTAFDDASLQELAESIRAQGVMQPILVRPVEPSRASEGATHEIIAGERRFRAARLAGLDAVPVLVRDVSDDAAAAMALIENIQRQDLNPLDEARGLRRLTDEFGMTHEAAASAVGRSRSAASNLLRLLQLAEPVQRLLQEGRLEMGHARALLPLDRAQQIAQAEAIGARRLSVREAERLVARVAAGAGRRKTSAGGDAQRRDAREWARVAERLADRLAAPVEIRRRGKGAEAATRGEIVIAFASLDELEGLVERLAPASP